MSLKERKVRGAVEILLYIPNVIGYLRLCLLLVAYLYLWTQPHVFITLYLFSITLDFFDGWAARIFNQQSSFGAWLDVIIDNISRTLLWANIAQWGWMIIAVEWITFVGNHQAGAKWRESVKDSTKNMDPPYFVQKVMANGFKTPLGTLVIFGLHVLPVWIYAMETHLLNPYISMSLSMIVCIMLAIGRLICLSVEIWCIKKHIRELLWKDQMNTSIK